MYSFSFSKDDCHSFVDAVLAVRLESKILKAVAEFPALYSRLKKGLSNVRNHEQR